jgi:hypothetical protein
MTARRVKDIEGLVKKIHNLNTGKPSRCQFAEGKDNHCKERPTRKWGDNWFCGKHGSRG